MKKFDRFKSSALYLLALAISLGAMGCVNLHQPSVEIKTYSIDVDGQEHAAFQGDAVSLKIHRFSAAPAFADRYFTYRTAETVYEQDFYNQFMAAPSKIIEDQIYQWMLGSPLVDEIVDSASLIQPDYVLEGSLVDLSGDYRQLDQPRASLELVLTLSREDENAPQVIFQKQYSAQIAVNQTSPKSLSEGWSEGLRQIAAEFESDFMKLLLESPKSNYHDNER